MVAWGQTWYDTMQEWDVAPLCDVVGAKSAHRPASRLIACYFVVVLAFPQTRGFF